MFSVKMINLTGEPTTLSQQAFGVFEPDDVEAVRALLEPGEGEDMAERAEALIELAVQHQAELALLEQGTAFSEALGRALLRRGIRTIYASSRVFSLYPISEHKKRGG